jgi:hypothetical protein
VARRVRKKKTPKALPVPSQKSGYNTELFPNPRSVRRALKRLGYKVNLVNTAVPSGIARQFQKDFNLCVMNKHIQGEVLKIDRIMGPRSLNALERALGFAQKVSAQKGMSTEQFWQNLCRAVAPKKPKPGPVGKGKIFVELLGNGVGRLRRPDGTLRVRVEELARKGNLLFAKITIPKQAEHEGDSHPRWVPAIAR